MSGIDLSDPLVLRDLRRQVSAFVQVAESACSSGASDLARAIDWLRGEQVPFWKRRIRDSEELYQQARRVWLSAENDVRMSAHTRGPGKNSSFEEKLLMDKAKRRRDEAEQKLALVQQWILRLERDGAPLAQQCRSCGLAVHELGTAAVAQLDHLTASVERYLDRPAGRGDL